MIGGRGFESRRRGNERRRVLSLILMRMRWPRRITSRFPGFEDKIAIALMPMERGHKELIAVALTCHCGWFVRLLDPQTTGKEGAERLCGKNTTGVKTQAQGVIKLNLENMT